MSTTYQHNPNQAGMNILKGCETFRKVLMANIDPFLPLEVKIIEKSKIKKMDYNELCLAVKGINK